MATDKEAWKEIFGAVENDSTAFESHKLKRVGVVGLHDSLASELVDCFAAKPSVVNVGVHLEPDGTCSRLDIMPGVTALPTARDVCAWSDIIFLCGSYEDANDFLRTQGPQKTLKGKCVLQLTSGTPEEAITASNLAESAEARYLDAFVFSEGRANVFNHQLSAMMVSGDKEVWREVEEVVRTVAPASFYGGRRVEWANTIGVGVVTFLASVRMGVVQAETITSAFGMSPKVLPRILNSGYMHVVKHMLASAAAKPNTFGDVHSVNNELVQGERTTSPAPASLMQDVAPVATPPGAAASVGVGTAPVESEARISQLERIREVCQKAHVSHSVIDGFLAASGSSSQQQQAQTADLHVLSSAVLSISATNATSVGTAGGNCKEVQGPFEDVFGQDEASETLDFDVQQLMMETDMVGDGMLLAGCAP